MTRHYSFSYVMCTVCFNKLPVFLLLIYILSVLTYKATATDPKKNGGKKEFFLLDVTDCLWD